MTRARQHHRLGPTTALALATTLALGACTSDDPPPSQTQSPAPVAESPTPEASPTPSPSPSPSGPVAPERPAAMDRDDADGAAAAAEYILTLEQPMMVTGDTREWKARSHRTCEYCKSRLEQATTIAERGDTFAGGEVSIKVETVYQRDPVTGIWPIDVTIHEAAATITADDGQTVFESDADSGARRIEMGQVDGEWVLVERAQIPSE
jgi:hypothetical protein